jgi:hypothetical protein
MQRIRIFEEGVHPDEGVDQSLPPLHHLAQTQPGVHELTLSSKLRYYRFEANFYLGFDYRC